jgi:hypothetical protein
MKDLINLLMTEKIRSMIFRMKIGLKFILKSSIITSFGWVTGTYKFYKWGIIKLLTNPFDYIFRLKSIMIFRWKFNFLHMNKMNIVNLWWNNVAVFLLKLSVQFLSMMPRMIDMKFPIIFKKIIIYTEKWITYTDKIYFIYFSSFSLNI